MTSRIAACFGNLPQTGDIPGWHCVSGDDAGATAWLVAADIGTDFLLPWHTPIVAVVGSGPVNTDLIDACAGWVFIGDAPDEWGRVLDAAVGPGTGGHQVRDLSDKTAAAIGALSAEASRIAEALQAIAARDTPAQPVPVTVSTVRRLIRLRRDRERFLPAMLFADPAWDMLLDLTAARLEGVDVPVSSLCIAAAVPTTTALRWVRTMTEAGLFERYADLTDARRSHIRLTAAAADAMLGWLRLTISEQGQR